MAHTLKTAPPPCVAVYIRGRVSNDDCRPVIIGAVINRKPDALGRKIMSLNCSVAGESVVDYNAEHDDCPASNINETYRSLLDGNYTF